MSAGPGHALVTLYTHRHRYMGRLINRGFRLFDLLTDANTSYLELHAVSIRSGDPGAVELRSERTFLRKQDILLALPPTEHEAPVRRNNHRIEKQRFAVALALPQIMLSGIVRLPSRTAAETLVSDTSPLGDFLALTEVSIHHAAGLPLDNSCPVAIVRRTAIESIQFFEELRAPPGNLAAQAAGAE